MRWKMRQGKKKGDREDRDTCLHLLFLSFSSFLILPVSLPFSLSSFHTHAVSPLSLLFCVFPLWWFLLSPAVFIPTVDSVFFTLQCDPLCLDLTTPGINMHPHMPREAIKLWWSLIIFVLPSLSKNGAEHFVYSLHLFCAPDGTESWLSTFNRVKKQGTRAAYQAHCNAGKQWFCWRRIPVWSTAQLNFSCHSGLKHL